MILFRKIAHDLRHFRIIDMINIGKKVMRNMEVKTTQEKARKPVIMIDIIGSGKLVLKPGVGQMPFIIRQGKFTFGRCMG